MNSYSRSLGLTAALLIAAAISMLVGAAPPVVDQTDVQETAGERAGAPPRALPAVAPISLTDPDGQELIIEDLDIRVAIHGMLSLTEIEYRFRNPKSKRVEGRFTATLPPNAAISRFAKEVNGALMEGEVVERLRANQIYESYLHQMRDPALLEQDQGNRFSARIFPIEANDTVRILLSYSMLLPAKGGERTYSLPLRGIPEVGDFSFRASVFPLAGESVTAQAARGPRFSQTSVDVFTIEERQYRPVEDIELQFQTALGTGEGRVFRAGNFYLATIRPRIGAANGSNRSTNDWLFYVDTSASAAEGAEHRIAALESLLRELPSGDRVEVVAFDNGVVPLLSGGASNVAGRIGQQLRDRLFLGGTDLAAALRHAARAATSNPSRTIVFVSDLAATLGQTTASDLLTASAAIPAHARVHALILGSRQHGAIAKQLTSGRGRVVTVPFTETLEANAREAARALRRPLGGSVEVRDASAEWSYPNRFTDIQPGDEIIVLGRSRGAAEPQMSVAGVGRLQATTLTSSTFEPLLEREAYRAYLEYLAEREAAEPNDAIRRALGTEAVRVSIEQRVVIPRTTMLVLENEWEYQRWGLDRRALSAILTIDAAGISRVDRSRDVPLVGNLRRERVMPVTAAPPPVGVPQPELQSGSATSQRNASRDSKSAVEQDAAAVGAVAEAITVTASAPVSVPDALTFTFPSEEPRGQRPAMQPPAAPPPPPRPPFKRGDENWMRYERPTPADIDRLRNDLRRDPRNRSMYNALSDALFLHGEWRDLRELALEWQPYDPDNPQVYESLGLAAEKLGRTNEAERAFASLIELATGKPELLQRAGLLLVRVDGARLAETPLRRALELRPDRVNAYRHLALMLWQDGRPDEAAEILESALRQAFPGWYGNVHRVVREELAYVYRSWGNKTPSRRAEIEDRAKQNAVDLSSRDAIRVSLAWETDANDVDLHVVDPQGTECFYGNRTTSSGLELYEDITQGLGPEVIRARRAPRGTYNVGVRYFASGPMGVSRGVVVIMTATEGSEPSVEIVPFRLMEGGAPIRHVAAVDVR